MKRVYYFHLKGGFASSKRLICMFIPRVIFDFFSMTSNTGMAPMLYNK